MIYYPRTSEAISSKIGNQFTPRVVAVPIIWKKVRNGTKAMLRTDRRLAFMVEAGMLTEAATNGARSLLRSDALFAIGFWGLVTRSRMLQ